MKAIWTDCALAAIPAESHADATLPDEKQAGAIRSLDEWELALASGGEGGWEWP